MTADFGRPYKRWLNEAEYQSSYDREGNVEEDEGEKEEERNILTIIKNIKLLSAIPIRNRDTALIMI